MSDTIRNVTILFVDSSVLIEIEKAINVNDKQIINDILHAMMQYAKAHYLWISHRVKKEVEPRKEEGIISLIFDKLPDNSRLCCVKVSLNELTREFKEFVETQKNLGEIDTFMQCKKLSQMKGRLQKCLPFGIAKVKCKILTKDYKSIDLFQQIDYDISAIEFIRWKEFVQDNPILHYLFPNELT